MVTRALIAGCGGYLPERVLDNEALGREFLKEGGFSERLLRERQQRRRDEEER